MGAAASVTEPQYVEVYTEMVRTLGPIRQGVDEFTVREALVKIYGSALANGTSHDDALAEVKQEYVKHVDVGRQESISKPRRSNVLAPCMQCTHFSSFEALQNVYYYVA